MKKHLLPLFAMMVSFAFFGCSDSKAPANESAASAVKTAQAQTSENATTAEVKAVEGTKTVTLANGAKVTWLQDN